VEVATADEWVALGLLHTRRLGTSEPRRSRTPGRACRTATVRRNLSR